MAKESVKILRGKLDVDNLLSQLNAALAEEWLAYYQYWVGALVVEGAMRSDVQGESRNMPRKKGITPNYWQTGSSNWKEFRYLIRNNGLN